MKTQLNQDIQEVELSLSENIEFERIKMDIINDLSMKNDELLLGAFGNVEKKEQLGIYIKNYLAEKNIKHISAENLVNSICGLLFIEDIIKDEDITDLSWNGTELWVQHNKKGRYHYTDNLLTENQVGMLISKIGNAINKSCYYH